MKAPGATGLEQSMNVRYSHIIHFPLFAVRRKANELLDDPYCEIEPKVTPEEHLSHLTELVAQSGGPTQPSLHG